MALGSNPPITSMAPGITRAGNDHWIVDLKSQSVANLVRISTGTASVPFLVNPNVGAPAGIATKLDGSALLVSTLANGSDALLEVDLPSGQTKSWTAGVSNTDVSPSGLHRAKGVDVYAWCDHGSPGALYNVHWN